MLRSVVGRVAWAARATTTVVGLAIMLALVFGAASAALGANGNPFILGKSNVATAISTLTNRGNGPALRLNVKGGEPPLAVNSSKVVGDLNADQLDGKDFGAFAAKEVIDVSGPLPLEGTYTSKGGTLIVSVSGSAYRGTGSSQKEGAIAMDVKVDGGLSGFLRAYTNERNSHKAFVSKDFVVSGLQAGEHTIELGRVYAAVVCNTASETQDAPCTTTDQNDRFTVTVVEIPD